MKPITDWPASERAGIRGVFTDIDDTLTTDGKITGDALAALARLRAAGIHVVPITGRPVGWSEPFALQWPVDAIVAENGGVALVCRRKSLHPHRQPNGEGTNSFIKLYQQDKQLRAVNFARMQQVARRIVREVPGAGHPRLKACRPSHRSTRG